MDLMLSAAVVGLFVLAAATAWPAMYDIWIRVRRYEAKHRRT